MSKNASKVSLKSGDSNKGSMGTKKGTKADDLEIDELEENKE